MKLITIIMIAVSSAIALGPSKQVQSASSQQAMANHDSITSKFPAIDLATGNRMPSSAQHWPLVLLETRNKGKDLVLYVFVANPSNAQQLCVPLNENSCHFYFRNSKDHKTVLPIKYGDSNTVLLANLDHKYLTVVGPNNGVFCSFAVRGFFKDSFLDPLEVKIEINRSYFTDDSHSDVLTFEASSEWVRISPIQPLVGIDGFPGTHKEMASTNDHELLL